MKCFLSLVLVSEILLSTASAQARISGLNPAIRCQSSLIRESLNPFKESLRNYFIEVRSSKGMSLFLSPAKSTDIRWGGLLEASEFENKGVLERLHYLLWKLPLLATGLEKTGQYELSPLGLVNEQLLNRPLRFASSKFNRELEASTLTSFAFDAMLLVVVFDFLDEQFNHQLNRSLHKQLESQKSTLDQLIQYDRRYYGIQLALVNKKITQAGAQQAAFVLSRILGDFYQVAYRPDFKADDQELLRLTLFSDLLNIQTSGVQVGKNYLRLNHFSERPNSQTIHQLVKDRVELLLCYDLVMSIVLGNLKDQAKSRSPLISQIIQDSFFQELSVAFEMKQISKLQFIQYAQENLYWQHRLKDYATLGLQRQVDETTTPITLDIFQAEIRNEIQKEIASKPINSDQNKHKQGEKK